MGELKEVPKPKLAGEDPTLPFYLAVSISNLDGTLDDLGGEGVEGLFDTEQQAVRALVDLNEGYPTIEGFVFHCVPVKRVWRGKTKVSAVVQKAEGKS